MPPRVAPLDGGSADDKGERLLDVIFGVQGACEHCLPRRVPAEYLLAWEVTQTYLDEIDPDSGYGPYCHLWRLCRRCVAETWSDADPLLPVVLIRNL